MICMKKKLGARGHRALLEYRVPEGPPYKGEVRLTLLHKSKAPCRDTWVLLAQPCKGRTFIIQYLHVYLPYRRAAFHNTTLEVTKYELEFFNHYNNICFPLQGQIHYFACGTLMKVVSHHSIIKKSCLTLGTSCLLSRYVTL